MKQSLDVILAEIDRTPLLSHEEELDLLIVDGLLATDSKINAANL